MENILTRIRNRTPQRWSLAAPAVATLTILGGALFATIGALYAAAVFIPDTQPTGWVAPPRVSNIDLSQGSAKIFRPYFNKADWSGNIFAFPIDTNGNVVATDELWGSGTGVNA